MKAAGAVLAMAGLMGTAAYAGCPSTLTWQDATHVEVSGSSPHGDIEAAIIKYKDGVWSRLKTPDDDSVVFYLHAAGAPSNIRLTRARKPFKPDELGELPMIVEPPMADGSWPRFGRPCGVKEGETLAFSEHDVPGSASVNGGFHGTVRRDGARIAYTFVRQEDGRDIHMRGVWQFQDPPVALPLMHDLQGFQVYREDELVMTLPAGAPLSPADVVRLLRRVKP